MLSRYIFFLLFAGIPWREGEMLYRGVLIGCWIRGFNGKGGDFFFFALIIGVRRGVEIGNGFFVFRGGFVGLMCVEIGYNECESFLRIGSKKCYRCISCKNFHTIQYILLLIILMIKCLNK